MKNNPWQAPIINLRGIERLQILPDWIKIGTVIVQNGETPLVAEIVGFTTNGNPIIEFDDSGENIEDWSYQEVSELFKPWSDGMKTADRTGKGRFANPSAWGEWWNNKNV
jgi:hypothetical protein